MLDLKNSNFAELEQIGEPEATALVGMLLSPDEQIVAAFEGPDTNVIFTNDRLLTLIVGGVTGKKRYFTSLWYNTIVCIELQTTTLDAPNPKLELLFRDVGLARLGFKGHFNIGSLYAKISELTRGQTEPA
ncbi:MAG: PH domain-containing protein [Pseudolysinimonas sp.]